MSLARNRIEHLNLASDHRARFHDLCETDLAAAYHHLLKVKTRAEREQRSDVVAYIKTALSAVEDTKDAL